MRNRSGQLLDNVDEGATTCLQAPSFVATEVGIAADNVVSVDQPHIRAVLNCYYHDGGPSLALGPPSWTRACRLLEREEPRAHSPAVVQELVEELSVGAAGGASALEDLNETQERDGLHPKQGTGCVRMAAVEMLTKWIKGL